MHLPFKWELLNSRCFLPCSSRSGVWNLFKWGELSGHLDTIRMSFETFMRSPEMYYGFKDICLILCSRAAHCKTLEISSHSTCTVFCRFIRWWNLIATHVFWSLMCTDRALWLRLKEDFSIMRREKRREKTKPEASSGRYLIWNTYNVFLGNDLSYV